MEEIESRNELIGEPLTNSPDPVETLSIFSRENVQEHSALTESAG